MAHKTQEDVVTRVDLKPKAPERVARQCQRFWIPEQQHDELHSGTKLYIFLLHSASLNTVWTTCGRGRSLGTGDEITISDETPHVNM